MAGGLLKLASFDFAPLARRYAQDERFMDYRLIRFMDYSTDWIHGL